MAKATRKVGRAKSGIKSIGVKAFISDSEPGNNANTSNDENKAPIVPRIMI